MRTRADARLDEALAGSGLHDPRDLCRHQLRILRERDPEAFGRALDHFESRLVPAIAEAGGDPIAEWFAYARFLAELTGPGRPVAVDATGRTAGRHDRDARDLLLLYLPDDARMPAMALQMPAALTPAQQATFDLLVSRKTA